MKAIKKLFTFIFLIILVIIIIVGYDGYKMYKQAITELPIDEKIQEIKNKKNYTKLEDTTNISANFLENSFF